MYRSPAIQRRSDVPLRPHAGTHYASQLFVRPLCFLFRFISSSFSFSSSNRHSFVRSLLCCAVLWDFRQRWPVFLFLYPTSIHPVSRPWFSFSFSIYVMFTKNSSSFFFSFLFASTGNYAFWFILKRWCIIAVLSTKRP